MPRRLPFKNSEYKKEIREFVKGGGKVTVYPEQKSEEFWNGENPFTTCHQEPKTPEIDLSP